jgi:tricorn protease
MPGVYSGSNSFTAHFPFGGPENEFYDLAGRWAVENEGVAPEIEVEYSPGDVIKGRDPQLERAIQEAMKLLELNPVKRVPRPEPIDRVSNKH